MRSCGGCGIPKQRENSTSPNKIENGARHAFFAKKNYAVIGLVSLKDSLLRIIIRKSKSYNNSEMNNIKLNMWIHEYITAPLMQKTLGEPKFAPD